MYKIDELNSKIELLTLKKGDESFIKGLEDDDHWKTTFLRLIADVWEGNVEDVYSMSYLELKELLKERYNYNLPKNLRLTFAQFKGQENYNSSKDRMDNGWESLFNESKEETFLYNGEVKLGNSESYYSAVEMMIPPKPVSNGVSAITDFMASGKVYPFTCL